MLLKCVNFKIRKNEDVLWGINSQKSGFVVVVIFFYKQAIYYDEGMVYCCKYRWTNKTKPEPLHGSIDEFI